MKAFFKIHTLNQNPANDLDVYLRVDRVASLRPASLMDKAVREEIGGVLVDVDGNAWAVKEHPETIIDQMQEADL